VEPIISVSGLRGIVGSSLTPPVAMRYVTAFSAECPPGPIVVTRDGRASGPMLVQAVAAALVAAGRNVLDAGVAATPTTGVLVRQWSAAGGIQVSASHNPAEYNGLKLFSRAGRVLPDAEGQRVLAGYRSSSFKSTAPVGVGAAKPLADTTSRHLELVLATVDSDAIRRRKFRVALDANHGAGSVLGARLLEALGCRVTLLGGVPDGQFEHPPEPTAENLATVLAQFVAAGADVGFCQDPDADRLAIVDERGRYLGEELTLALCLEQVLGQRPGPVVTNCATSRMAEDIAARHGVPFFRAAVGEANVVDKMLEVGAAIGGEGNGGVIDPRVVLVRDSFVGMALVLDALVRQSCRASELAARLPHYEIVKTKVALPPERLAAAYAAVERRFADARPDRLDGLRLDWPGRWLLIRPSNTEPIVRIIAEAATRDEAQRLCQEAAAAIETSLDT
jgi:phosphomannomutase